MNGIVWISKLSTDRTGGLTEVYASFTIEYDDGSAIPSEVSFAKYDYTTEDLLTYIKKYFKGDLTLSIMGVGQW